MIYRHASRRRGELTICVSGQARPGEPGDRQRRAMPREGKRFAADVSSAGRRRTWWAVAEGNGDRQEDRWRALGIATAAAQPVPIDDNSFFSATSRRRTMRRSLTALHLKMLRRIHRKDRRKVHVNIYYAAARSTPSSQPTPIRSSSSSRSLGRRGARECRLAAAGVSMLHQHAELAGSRMRRRRS